VCIKVRCGVPRDVRVGCDGCGKNGVAITATCDRCGVASYCSEQCMLSAIKSGEHDLIECISFAKRMRSTLASLFGAEVAGMYESQRVRAAQDATDAVMLASRVGSSSESESAPEADRLQKKKRESPDGGKDRAVEPENKRERPMALEAIIERISAVAAAAAAAAANAGSDTAKSVFSSSDLQQQQGRAVSPQSPTRVMDSDGERSRPAMIPSGSVVLLPPPPKAIPIVPRDRSAVFASAGRIAEMMVLPLPSSGVIVPKNGKRDCSTHHHRRHHHHHSHGKKDKDGKKKHSSDHHRHGHRHRRDKYQSDDGAKKKKKSDNKKHKHGHRHRGSDSGSESSLSFSSSDSSSSSSGNSSSSSTSSLDDKKKTKPNRGASVVGIDVTKAWWVTPRLRERLAKKKSLDAIKDSDSAMRTAKKALVNGSSKVSPIRRGAAAVVSAVLSDYPEIEYPEGDYIYNVSPADDKVAYLLLCASRPADSVAAEVAAAEAAVKAAEVELAAATAAAATRGGSRASPLPATEALQGEQGGDLAIKQMKQRLTALRARVKMVPTFKRLFLTKEVPMQKTRAKRAKDSKSDGARGGGGSGSMAGGSDAEVSATLPDAASSPASPAAAASSASFAASSAAVNRRVAWVTTKINAEPIDVVAAIGLDESEVRVVVDEDPARPPWLGAAVAAAVDALEQPPNLVYAELLRGAVRLKTCLACGDRLGSRYQEMGYHSACRASVWRWLANTKGPAASGGRYADGEIDVDPWRGVSLSREHTRQEFETNERVALGGEDEAGELQSCTDWDEFDEDDGWFVRDEEADSAYPKEYLDKIGFSALAEGSEEERLIDAALAEVQRERESELVDAMRAAGVWSEKEAEASTNMALRIALIQKKRVEQAPIRTRRLEYLIARSRVPELLAERAAVRARILTGELGSDDDAGDENAFETMRALEDQIVDLEKQNFPRSSWTPKLHEMAEKREKKKRAAEDAAAAVAAAASARRDDRDIERMLATSAGPGRAPGSLGGGRPAAATTTSAEEALRMLFDARAKKEITLEEARRRAAELARSSEAGGGDGGSASPEPSSSDAESLGSQSSSEGRSGDDEGEFEMAGDSDEDAFMDFVVPDDHHVGGGFGIGLGMRVGIGRGRFGAKATVSLASSAISASLKLGARSTMPLGKPAFRVVMASARYLRDGRAAAALAAYERNPRGARESMAIVRALRDARRAIEAGELSRALVSRGLSAERASWISDGFCAQAERAKAALRSWIIVQLGRAWL
jgi:uncharacterized membrane protein YgcG